MEQILPSERQSAIAPFANEVEAKPHIMLIEPCNDFHEPLSWCAADNCDSIDFEFSKQGSTLEHTVSQNCNMTPVPVIKVVAEPTVKVPAANKTGRSRRMNGFKAKLISKPT